MTRSKLFLLPILLGVIGVFLGWWTHHVTYGVGRHLKWRDLPTELLRPRKPIDILGGDFDANGLPRIYVETDDGRFYSCQRPTPMITLSGCWVQTDAPHVGTSHGYCDEYPDDLERHRRLAIADPPGIAIDRLRLERCGASSGVFEYVLLEDGTVWSWSFSPTNPWKTIWAAIFVIPGGCLGVLVGLILSRLGSIPA